MIKDKAPHKKEANLLSSDLLWNELVETAGLGNGRVDFNRVCDQLSCMMSEKTGLTIVINIEVLFGAGLGLFNAAKNEPSIQGKLVTEYFPSGEIAINLFLNSRNSLIERRLTLAALIAHSVYDAYPKLQKKESIEILKTHQSVRRDYRHRLV